jgi:hypothetical protein
MPSRVEYFDLLNRIAVLRARLADVQASERPEPSAQEAVARELEDLQNTLTNLLMAETPPADGGLAGLIGFGPGAATSIDDVRISAGVEPFDEGITSERLLAIADLYYIYQHERIGVFRAILKLQELFKAGLVRLSSGNGALALYQYDRRSVLRYSRKERHQSYRRVFGYTDAPPPAGARPNDQFHNLLTGFASQVARFFRDKRISEVVRPESRDLSFGSVAMVRRSGLDLRDNLRHASYGHVNVLTAEVSQLLEAAFRIAGADDVRRLFGADGAWDVIEEVLKQHLGERVVASQRGRLAIAGRELIRWLAQTHILTSGRVEFEGLLLAIGEFAEEWITSSEALGLAARSEAPGAIPLRRRPVAVPA